MLLKKIKLVVGLLLFGVLVSLGVYGIYSSGIVATVNEWLRPEYTGIEGRIESVEARQISRRSQPGWYPEVTFGFDVEGRHYTGHTLGARRRDGGTLRRYSDATIGKEFKIGQHLTVMYNPSDPTWSYAIVPGQKIDPLGYMPMLIVIVYNAFFLAMIIRMIRWIRRYGWLGDGPGGTGSRPVAV